MRNLGKDFSEGKVCVKVETIGQIDTIASVVNSWLFEDVSIINAKIYHGVYVDWLKKDINLSVGLVDNQAQVLSNEYFEELGYEQVGYSEFIENLRKW